MKMTLDQLNDESKKVIAHFQAMFDASNTLMNAFIKQVEESDAEEHLKIAIVADMLTKLEKIAE